MRLGCSPTTAYLYLGVPEHRGAIRHRRLGKKYHVTERAIREWEGDPIE
ncbi:helix-turn-helix domain-containing protein [Hymenobacter setariae]|uniref:Helix-turn-helix domain-containing protein n=1 Tax=Hymenobacter setariae TaxID=2594794 RepID=A0A558BVW0_9BACT|nr:helix-turn-helix domain-containing protein [Hymenobacter setariae]TVT40658.1 helix-turn-helix domain-containing protein [Hymenobacter setariae]